MTKGNDNVEVDRRRIPGLGKKDLPRHHRRTDGSPESVLERDPRGYTGSFRRNYMRKIKEWWLAFVEKHPKLSQWVREGGLFVIVSNVITVFKYLLLTFLPAALAFLGSRDFGFPGIDLTLFGISFKWYIIGYGAEQGGIAYFTAYMIAMVIGEIINFFIQRSFVFRSKGNILKQGMWYVLAFCVVTCVVNSINCIWAAVAGHFVAPWLYNIGTTFLNGGVSMVVFFVVNKIIFPEGEAKKK